MPQFTQRLFLWLGFALLVALLSSGVYRYGLGEALRQLKARGSSDLALAEDRLITRLQRYQELAVTQSDHPSLVALHRGGSRARAEDFLRTNADKTGALGMAYLDRSGAALAVAGRGSDADALGGLWARRALQQGALGTGQARLKRDGKRAYFYAAPDFGEDGQVRGALVVIVDIDEVEFGWRSSTPTVYFVGDGGAVFLSNRSELVFARVGQAGQAVVFEDGATRAVAKLQRAGEEVWALDLGPYIPRRALHLQNDLPQIGLRAEALIDIAPAERIAALQAAVFAALCVAFGAILFLVLERRRALVEANHQLESRVEARTAELRRTQAELVQAGKLSALGQMSAGISHELNQPLMAIRQFADNGVRFLGRGKADVAEENLGRISELAARAARIIKNLRAFARNESEPMSKVDLCRVLGTAAELTEARRREAGAALAMELPEGPIFVRAGEVRLAQVFVNLINNAVDAMAGQPEGARAITLVAARKGERVVAEVRDTGPGIADPEKIFEPFYTTKEVASDEGMGLGLSISYGLVQSFGGMITGRNAAGGGAVFAVKLEAWRDDGPDEKTAGERG